MDKPSHNLDDKPEFEDDGGAPRPNAGLFLRLEGYEGPIDLLLDVNQIRMNLVKLRIEELISN